MKTLWTTVYRYGVSLLPSICLVSILGWGLQAKAAETVVFKYGMFEETLTLDQIQAFANAGELNSPLGEYLKERSLVDLALRKSLMQEISVDLIQLDRALNSPMGEFLLDRVGQAIGPHSGKANRQALRSAIVLSASQDRKLSILKVIRNYPLDRIDIDGESLEKLYGILKQFGGSLLNYIF
ncbi:hypothetical protein TUMEXPCC7403_13645 [Tumidithrix helvetica PCC 7403]|uniref:alpha/beta hydrolase n=1 Tax=Tumidithrix helvetica TaxID=3457545 RepID=UPI003CBF38D0